MSLCENPHRSARCQIKPRRNRPVFIGWYEETIGNSHIVYKSEHVDACAGKASEPSFSASQNDPEMCSGAKSAVQIYSRWVN